MFDEKIRHPFRAIDLFHGKKKTNGETHINIKKLKMKLKKEKALYLISKPPKQN